MQPLLEVIIYRGQVKCVKDSADTGEDKSLLCLALMD